MGFKRVLIANRGEIALRILRTLRDMGIESAIIHGREDRLSLPVRMADFAHEIPRINPLDSYLDIEAVVQAAKELQCDAVHPGYGFLAENAGFVKRLEEENITFIGPSADVISLLGDKIEARAAMENAGLPTAKGKAKGKPTPAHPPADEDLFGDNEELLEDEDEELQQKADEEYRRRVEAERDGRRAVRAAQRRRGRLRLHLVAALEAALARLEAESRVEHVAQRGRARRGV